MITAAPRLAQLATRYFLKPDPFLDHFEADPLNAIVRLRDDPKSFGALRSYLGATMMADLHAKLLSAARRQAKATCSPTEVMATRHTRQVKPKKISPASRPIAFDASFPPSEFD